MLYLHNTLTNKEELFEPLDKNNIKMYVCGPTVYDRPHLGNARSVVFYDFLFNVLSSIYPNVTYVRNITDIDDKIIARAKEKNITEKELAQQVQKQFEEDMSQLLCKKPTFEPCATEYISQMLEIIDLLIQKGHAYKKNDEVLFSVKSCTTYGELSNRTLEEMISGSRIEVSDSKQCEYDFVLWKPAKDDEISFESKFGRGRPGWHTECVAMSSSILGNEFDIHGGGVDLQFPHHENEIAQSKCSSGSNFAKYWIHNGFLMVNGQKMSKSLGNFTTVKDLLDKGITGTTIRFALLSTHYRKPLDFNTHLMDSSTVVLDKFSKILEQDFTKPSKISFEMLPQNAQDALKSNLNISKYIAVMHSLASDIKNTKNDPTQKQNLCKQFFAMSKILGIC